MDRVDEQSRAICGTPYKMKKNNQTQRIRHKLRGDGTQIADLERAVHKGKTSRKHAVKAPITKVTNLLGSRHEQEMAWITCVMNPEKYAARIPISQTLGAVPVDLYRVAIEVTGAVGTAGAGYYMTNPDSWYMHLASGQLHANGGASYCGVTTDAASGNLAFPISSATAGTGRVFLSVPDVSADFASNGLTGTEYMMVGASSTISMFAPAAGQDRYNGEVIAIYSMDVERAPIAGTAQATIVADARKTGSLYRVAIYAITGSGLFALKESISNGVVTNHTPPSSLDGSAILEDVGITELSISDIPLSSDCYKWRRIGNQTLQVIAGDANVGFCVTGPAGQSYKCRHTILWQTERYASALVRRSVPSGHGMSSESDMLSIAANIVQGLRPGWLGNHNVAGSAVLSNAANTPGFLNQLAGHVNGVANVIGSASGLYKALSGAKGDLMAVLDHFGSFSAPSTSSAGFRPAQFPTTTPTIEVLGDEASSALGLIEDGLEYGVEIAPEVAMLFA